jgi:putative hydrolase of the HAD superfamily
LDFNGVLTSDLFEAYGAFCRESGLPHGALLALLTDDPDGHALLKDLERGSTTTQPQFEQAIGQRLGIDGTGLVERVCQHLKPEPLLLDFAERARGAGVRTEVLTNSLGLAPYNPYLPWRQPERFDVVVISEEIGMREPDPGIFAVALDRLGVPDEARVFVDDMAHNLPPARALDMTTLHLTDPKQAVAELERLLKSVA